jgi:hypothetical protein
MKILVDCFGREIRLTDERLDHILEHPELQNMEDNVQRLSRSRKLFGPRDPTLLCGCSMASIRKPL